MREKQGIPSAVRKVALAAALAAVSAQAGATLVADGKFDINEGYQLGITFGINDTHGTTNYGKLYFGQDAAAVNTSTSRCRSDTSTMSTEHRRTTMRPVGSAVTRSHDLLNGDAQKISWGGTAGEPDEPGDVGLSRRLRHRRQLAARPAISPPAWVPSGTGGAGTSGAVGEQQQRLHQSREAPRRSRNVATSLEYNLNTVIGGTGANTELPLANPNWIKEVGYEIQFAAGTFNASDWVNKDKAPGLITLDDPAAFRRRRRRSRITRPRHARMAARPCRNRAPTGCLAWAPCRCCGSRGGVATPWRRPLFAGSFPERVLAPEVVAIPSPTSKDARVDYAGVFFGGCRFESRHPVGRARQRAPLFDKGGDGKDTRPRPPVRLLRLHLNALQFLHVPVPVSAGQRSPAHSSLPGIARASPSPGSCSPRCSSTGGGAGATCRCSLASIAFNYVAGEAIARRGGKPGGNAFGLLCGAVAVNLAVLGYFKYAGFLVANVDALLGAGMRMEAIVLPLGISFFTFTQIAYLVDVYRDPVRYGVVPYALFVSYFPHLIAGPILHHREMMPQFAAPTSYRLDYANLAAGLTIFAIGLFKKTVLADGIAPYASPVFAQAARGYAPGMRGGVGRRPRVRAAALFRLLGVFGHGGRPVEDARHPDAGQFRIAVQGDEHHRVLASLAHDAVAVPARLPLHRARRQPSRRRCAATPISSSRCCWAGSGTARRGRSCCGARVHGAFLAINHGWRAVRASLPAGPGVDQSHRAAQSAPC